MKTFFGTVFGKVVIGVVVAAVAVGSGLAVYQSVKNEVESVAEMSEKTITTKNTTEQEATESPSTTTTYPRSGVVELSPIMYEPYRELAKKLGFWVSEPDDGYTYFRTPADDHCQFDYYDRLNAYEIALISKPFVSFYGILVGERFDISKIPTHLYDDVKQSNGTYALIKGNLDKYQFETDENGIVTRMAFRYTLP